MAALRLISADEQLHAEFDMGNLGRETTAKDDIEVGRERFVITPKTMRRWRSGRSIRNTSGVIAELK